MSRRGDSNHRCPEDDTRVSDYDELKEESGTYLLITRAQVELGGESVKLMWAGVPKHDAGQRTEAGEILKRRAGWDDSQTPESPGECGQQTHLEDQWTRVASPEPPMSRTTSGQYLQCRLFSSRCRQISNPTKRIKVSRGKLEGSEHITYMYQILNLDAQILIRPMSVAT
jgi:hypothetical protein